MQHVQAICSHGIRAGEAHGAAGDVADTGRVAIVVRLLSQLCPCSCPGLHGSNLQLHIRLPHRKPQSHWIVAKTPLTLDYFARFFGPAAVTSNLRLFRYIAMLSSRSDGGSQASSTSSASRSSSFGLSGTVGWTSRSPTICSSKPSWHHCLSIINRLSRPPNFANRRVR